jgi:hypothetical protein
MKSSPDGTIHTFATFRVAGDDLIPSEVTDILHLFPTKAYSKGETYQAGSHAGTRTGKTGVWYFATDTIVASHRLVDHILFLVSVMAPDSTLAGALIISKATVDRQIAIARFFGRLNRLKAVLQKRNLSATLTLFWHGSAGAKPPTIPRALLTVFKLFSIEIEMDFDAEETRAA